jgi:hypothetical protein
LRVPIERFEGFELWVFLEFGDEVLHEDDNQFHCLAEDVDILGCFNHDGVVGVLAFVEADNWGSLLVFAYGELTLRTVALAVDLAFYELLHCQGWDVFMLSGYL